MKVYINKLLKIYDIQIFYLLFLNVLMIIILSSFGQTFLFGANLSFIIPLLFFLVYISNFRRIPLTISVIYIILILYTLAITLAGKDFYHWSISVFTLSSISLFGLIKSNEKNYLPMMTLSSLFSLVLLISYNYFGVLSNWNPNSIGMFATFGLLGFIFTFKITKSNVLKFFYLILIIFSVYCIYLTDSRNNIMIFLIAFLTNFFMNFFNNKFIFRVYYLFALFSAMLIAKLSTWINNLTYLKPLVEFSYEYTGKGTIFSDRDIFWGYIEILIGNNGLFGNGVSLYNYIYSHNIFYSIQYFFGIIGFMLYVLLIIVILEYIYKYSKKDKISMSVVYIFIAICFGQISENALFTSDLAIFLPYIYLSIGLFRTRELNVSKLFLNKKERRT
ncbi:hypothetical protein QWY16_15140 [Planococcus shenhongbingii]|uniref:O-antigen ligase family protein n=1 Tax=Planococcus shenhongbingii TaxID=3058398 RepID=UPI002627AC49|nr:hypothetical protein [Planococcus sp. N016]WKA57818.1 hypothetical protein QWY16_15140 [Planococcus sp. N016]